MYIYIAAPLTKGHRIANIRAAIDAAERIAVRGHQVYIPHLYDLWELIHPHNYEFWMEQDFRWIVKCDILVRLPGESLGADREVEFATKRNMPVFHGLEAFMNSSYWAFEENKK